MAIRITADTMIPEMDTRVVATARFSKHTEADGNGAWIVSTCPARFFDRGHVITALVAAGLLAVGYADNDPLVMPLRTELRRPIGSSAPRLPSPLNHVEKSGVAGQQGCASRRNC
jgi:hypothetical protein